MKRINHYLLSLVLLAICFNACNDDDDTNLEPVSNSDFTFEVSESIGDTEVIGTVTATDESSALTFSMRLNDNALFEITESGELSLAAGKSLDYETAKSHDIVVEVSDGTLSSPVSVRVNVTDDLTDNSIASFAETAVTVDEYAGEMTFTVTFDQPLIIDASIQILIAGTATSGAENDFSVTPDGSEGVLEYNLLAGDTAISFTVNFTDDADLEEDETITFTLFQTADVLMPDENNGILTITIISEDTGELYLVKDEGNTPLLYAINLNSGKKTDLADQITHNGTPITYIGYMDFYDGALYFIDQNNDTYNLYAADINTGEATQILVLEDYIDLFGGAEGYNSLSKPTGLEIVDGYLYFLGKSSNDANESKNWLGKIAVDGTSVEATEITNPPSFGVNYGLGLIGETLYAVQSQYAPSPTDSALAAIDMATGQFIENGALPIHFSDADVSMIDRLGLMGDWLTLSSGYMLASYFSATSLIIEIDETGTARVVSEFENSSSFTDIKGCMIPSTAVNF